MRIQGLASGIAIVATSLSAAVFGDAHAQSAGADAEIAALKQQLRLMEQKLDKLQRQTAANTTAAATANAKADAKVNVANAAAYPVNSQIAPSDAVVKMPNNRPKSVSVNGSNEDLSPLETLRHGTRERTGSDVMHVVERDEDRAKDST